MNFHRIIFVAVPLLLIVVPAILRARRDADPYLSRMQMCSLWICANAMLVAIVGFGAMLATCLTHISIPGRASDGGLREGRYYFNWHDETLTEVSRETWVRTWFLEQLSEHVAWVGVATFAVTFAGGVLVATLMSRGQLKGDRRDDASADQG